jgi:hypothetical protein
VAALRSFRAADAEPCLAIIASNLPEYFDPSEIADYEAFVAAPEGPWRPCPCSPTATVRAWIATTCA